MSEIISGWGENIQFGIGLLLMVMVFILVTIDVLIIPTMILTIISLTGWFIYLAYIYTLNPTMSFFFGIIFLLLGVAYVGVILKLKLWKEIVHQDRVPADGRDWNKIIEEVNQKNIVASTDLRPTGKIKIEDEVHDGLSEDGFIVSGTVLEIINYVEGQYKVIKK